MRHPLTNFLKALPALLKAYKDGQHWAVTTMVERDGKLWPEHFGCGEAVQELLNRSQNSQRYMDSLQAKKSSYGWKLDVK